jgi:polar amino acid transport system substrate-binding protein
MARILFLFMLSLSALADPVLLLTYVSPRSPYEVPLMQEAMRRAGRDYHIETMPWARALALAESRPNTLLFSVARVPEREASYIWITDLLRSNYYVWSLRSRPVTLIRGSQSLAGYRVGVLANGRDHLYVKRFGVPEAQILPAAEWRGAFAMLAAGKADVLVGHRFLPLEWCTLYLEKCSDFQPIADLGAGPSWYVAASRNTDPALVSAVQRALGAMRRDGTFDSIMGPLMRDHP